MVSPDSWEVNPEEKKQPLRQDTTSCNRHKSHKLRDVKSAKFHLLTKFNTRVSVGTNCKTGVKRKSQLYCLSSPEAVQASVSLE